MKKETEIVLKELEQITQRIINEVEEMRPKGMEVLNRKSSEDSWSALECLDHLNQYGDYYIPEMSNAIEKDRRSLPSLQYKSGWLGNYFANMMIPTDGMKKMKSPKDKLPIQSNIKIETIDRFLDQQNEILSLLKKARNHNIGKLKCSISISKVIKLKLGDTLRFVIYHNWRHLEQAKKALL